MLHNGSSVCIVSGNFEYTNMANSWGTIGNSGTVHHEAFSLPRKR